MKKKFGKKRYFLNPKEGVEAASFNVEVEEDLNSKKTRWPYLDNDVSLEISDCDGQIVVGCNVWVEGSKKRTLASLKERRAKVKRLQEIVDAFAESALESFDYMESRLDDYYKAYDAKKKEQKKG